MFNYGIYNELPDSILNKDIVYNSVKDDINTFENLNFVFTG